MDFYNELFAMKNVLRAGWLRVGVQGRVESDAEHTFSTLLLALKILQHNDLALDELKVLKMIAYHELGEIDAGDITPYDGVSAEDKHTRELAAIERISKEYTMPELLDIWLEFEEQSTPEARFVKALDKYDAVRQAETYEAMGLAPQGCGEEFYRMSADLTDMLRDLDRSSKL